MHDKTGMFTTTLTLSALAYSVQLIELTVTRMYLYVSVASGTSFLICQLNLLVHDNPKQCDCVSGGSVENWKDSMCQRLTYSQIRILMI